ncbi:MAG TPA: sialidase family protein [Gemmatimonadaceae bacterium]
MSAVSALGACSGGPAVELEPPTTLSAPTAVGAAPMFVIAPDGRRTAAWISAPGGGSDGRLYISTDGGPPTELRDPLGAIEAHGESPPKLAYAPDGALHALYAVAKVVPGRRFPASALRAVRSEDGGRTWSEPVTVTDAAEFGSHNFHALHADARGIVWASWLDGRGGKSAAYVTRSTDGGRTWAPNVRVDMGESCPCCRTAVATDPRDPSRAYMSWRTVAPGNVREVVVAASTDGGATWGAPVRAQRDGWVFEGCPHAGPALRVDSAGRVHIAWWSGKDGAAGVFYARSDDGARTFGEPVPLGTAAFSRPAHVQLAVDGRDVVAAWDDGRVEVPRVLVRVSRDGGERFARAITASDSARIATYPVLTLAGGRLTIAWSERGAEADEHAAHAPPPPGATGALRSVGASQVIVREGRIEGGS